MSGLIGKIKGIFSSQADTVTDLIDDHVTSERIDDVLDRVPGGDKIREHVPDDAGEKLGGAVRCFGGDPPKDDKQPPAR